jgi:hypothetical protein
MQEVHGDNDEPQHNVYPALSGYSHKADREGSLAKSARHDNQRLGDLTQECDAHGVLRNVNNDPFNVPAKTQVDGPLYNARKCNEEDLSESNRKRRLSSR